MLSAKGLSEAEVRKLVRRDLESLAPRFRIAVEAALVECHRVGLDAMVYESVRSDEVQRAYYALGRTTIPPNHTVTKAKTAMGSWHFYGLAVDVISKAQGWRFTSDWIRRVANIFKKHGCDWGGDWKSVDLPHFQWGRCRHSPSQAARDLYRKGGNPLVWAAVGAADAVQPKPSPAKPTRPTLRPGDTGHHVGALQALLGVVGPDVFGPKTTAAVRNFQASKGLTPNAIVDEATWAALERRP